MIKSARMKRKMYKTVLRPAGRIDQEQSERTAHVRCFTDKASQRGLRGKTEMVWTCTEER